MTRDPIFFFSFLIFRELFHAATSVFVMTLIEEKRRFSSPHLPS